MNTRRRHYWDRFVDDTGHWRSDARPPGEELAALRRGVGREPGTVPSMWRFHQVQVPEEDRDRGFVSDLFVGEHHALALFSIHQQSQSSPAHHPGVGVGRALRALHATGAKSGDASKAVDRRFYAAVTATTTDEVAHHLRGLVRLLRSLKSPAPLDYGRLAQDLAGWGRPERRDRIRRRWGLDYHAPTKDTDDGSSPSTAAATTD
jgi:CRISPR system Cascade subunit CasB